MNARRTRVAVVGVGAVGSMALWRLALRGVHVTGYEQHHPGHDDAAYGGRTRLVRVLSQRSRANVPLLLQAKALWEDLHADSGRTLLTSCGALTIGPREDDDVAAVIRCAEQVGLPFELLGPADMRSRFPQHGVEPDEIAIHDPSSGVVRSNVAVRAATAVATGLGATLRQGETVTAIRSDDTGAIVSTDAGDEHYDHVVVTPGPWVGRLLPHLQGHVTPRGVVSAWFRPRDGFDGNPEAFPPGLRRFPDTSGFTFFPAIAADPIKVNLWIPRRPEIEDVSDWDPTADPAVIEATSAAIAKALPGVDPAPIATRAYPEGFTADRLPLVGRIDHGITVLTGFSGIGFAISPLMGDVAADLALLGGTATPIDHFDIHRTLSTTSPSTGKSTDVEAVR
jgi:sarcosine oxidase